MALAIGGAGVDESSALGTNVFGVQRVVIRVAKLPVPARRRLRKRLSSELDAVRDLLSKAELYSCASGAAGKDDRLFAPDAPVEEGGGGRAAKSRKVSPFAGRTRESKPDDRERLAGRLASMAVVLPDHVVAFLQDRRVGDADSRGDDGDIEMDDVQSMKDGALFQLKMLLDKFAPASTPKLLVDKFAPEESTPKRHGGRAPLVASGISCPSQAQNQEAGDRLPPVQEEQEEGMNICGGVSRIAIRDIAEEYGELVDGIGVQLLSPLQRKYVDFTEQDWYVDICGDASPVVFPAKTGGSSSPSLSSSDSDSDATWSTDSDSSSSSPEALPKENSYCRAGEPVPAPEEIQIAEPENQCAAAVFPITETPPAPTVLPKECGTLAQPPEQAPEAVQIADPEELKEKCVAPVATTAHPITGSAPPPAVLPNENRTSSQSAPVPAPVAAQIAEPQPQPQEVPAPVAAQNEGAPRAPTQTNDLIAMARQEAKRRAMAKARQELLKLERAVLPDERIHPLDMELLGIVGFQHVVSTVRGAGTAPQPQVNDGVDLRVSTGHPSILQQLGIFLKADGGGEEDEEEEEQPPPLAVASDGEDMDMEIEDGQIL